MVKPARDIHATVGSESLLASALLLLYDVMMLVSDASYLHGTISFACYLRLLVCCCVVVDTRSCPLNRTASLSLQFFNAIRAPRRLSVITFVADPRKCGYTTQATSVCLHTHIQQGHILPAAGPRIVFCCVFCFLFLCFCFLV